VEIPVVLAVNEIVAPDAAAEARLPAVIAVASPDAIVPVLSRCPKVLLYGVPFTVTVQVPWS
jgi:hypothetical protein